MQEQGYQAATAIGEHQKVGGLALGPVLPDPPTWLASSDIALSFAGVLVVGVARDTPTF